jgi:hypothetical protein
VVTSGSTVSNANESYVWRDKTLETHRCQNCGCVSHWVAMDPGVDVMGVNARLMDPEVLAAARVRYSAGS